MNKWYQDEITFDRNGRALQGTVPVIQMDSEDGCAYAAIVSLGASKEKTQAIAASILREHESHEALVAALTACLCCEFPVTDREVVKQAGEALALARGAA